MLKDEIPLEVEDLPELVAEEAIILQKEDMPMPTDPDTPQMPQHPIESFYAADIRQAYSKVNEANFQIIHENQEALRPKLPGVVIVALPHLLVLQEHVVERLYSEQLAAKMQRPTMHPATKRTTLAELFGGGVTLETNEQFMAQNPQLQHQIRPEDSGHAA